MLEDKGIGTRVVSVPSFELFRQQDDRYREKILNVKAVKVGIEAAVRQGWDELIGSDGIFIGMSTYGESAPYEQLYAHFGITPQHVVAAVEKRV